MSPTASISSRIRRRLDLFLAPLVVLAFEQDAAISGGDIRVSLVQSATPIGGYDVLIAGHARSLNVTLVTNNVREFSRFPDLP